MPLRTPAKRIVAPQSRPYSFPAPTLGWVSDGNLAIAKPGAALILENWFPTSTGAVMRRGKQLYATLGNGDLPARSLFSYVLGNDRQFFGANDQFIYDITTISSAINFDLGTDESDIIGTDTGNTIGLRSTVGKEVYANTNGDWSILQFTTPDGSYLIGVNGTDDGFVYDGTNFFPNVDGGISQLAFDNESTAFEVGETITGGTSAATAVVVKVTSDGTVGELWLKDVSGTFQDNETITSASGQADVDGTATILIGGLDGVSSPDLSNVWGFKNRVFFIQKDSMDAWYLPAGQITGTAVKLPLGGVFSLGGSLSFGASWSLDTGGGLNATCAFFTTEGEVAVYQGDNPGDIDSWSQVGVYRVGKPMGRKAFIAAGGDLVVATDVGFVPLSQALQKDYAALSPSAVSAPIDVEWNDAVQKRSSQPWCCKKWSANQMTVVALPTVGDEQPAFFVANTRTGAWAKYTNWDAGCLEVFQDRLFFGSSLGRIYEANVTGSDDGQPYTATYLPSFDALGTPGLKSVSMARCYLRSSTAVREKITIKPDYQTNTPAVPDASPIDVGSVWGAAIWGQSVWGYVADKIVSYQWRSAVAFGGVFSPLVQITSGSLSPLDTEIIRTDIMYNNGATVA